MHPMLNIAVKAARRAGQIINRASLDLDLVQVAKKQHNDFVTEVDRASEAAIIDTLRTAYPDHAILAEESGRSENESEYQWIIDPLDGTTNFIHGFPYYCVSIALTHKGIVTQAVVYDPTRNDLFTASRGRGAFLNDRRIRVGRRDRLADSLIGTGFPWSEFLPKTGQARAVQIDIDPTMLGIRYPTEVNLEGDSVETLRALLPLLQQKTETKWRDGIAEGMKKW